MFWISCCLLREGLRGAGSVETTAGEEWVGTAERHKSIPKTTCVKANRTLNAVSDGAFAATHHDLPANFQRLPLKIALLREHNVRRFGEPAALNTSHCSSDLPSPKR